MLCTICDHPNHDDKLGYCGYPLEPPSQMFTPAVMRQLRSPTCNCTGVAVWRSVWGTEPEARKIAAALLEVGVSLYPFHSPNASKGTDYVVQVVNSQGEQVDQWIVTAFTDNPQHLLTREAVLLWLNGVDEVVNVIRKAA